MIKITTNKNIETLRPKFSKKFDIKLGHCWTFNKLCGNSIYSITKGVRAAKGSDNKGIRKIEVRGTCGCDVPCWDVLNDRKIHKNLCYGGKTYNRYGSNCMLAHAINTIWCRSRLAELSEILGGQLNRAKAPVMVRIHQFGELESVEELEMWDNLARLNPRHTFGIYTKRVDILIQFLKIWGGFSKNLCVNVSVWGASNAKFAREFVDGGFGNAFVVNPLQGYFFGVDSKKITRCTAYDENGKLNHKVPCEKCRKCYNNTSRYIQCYEH